MCFASCLDPLRVLLGQLVLIELRRGTFLQNYLGKRLKERYKWSRIYETNWILQVELDLLLKSSGLITASCIDR